MNPTSQKILKFNQKYGMFLLGSSSFSRKLILEQNQISFRVISPNIDEKSIGDRSFGSDPINLVTNVAAAKTDAILRSKLPELSSHRILITADQVVTQKGRILEKPNNIEEARQFITGYSESSCSTVGCLVLTDLQSNRKVVGVDSATIHFGQIPSSTIEQLLHEEACLQCAGGLMVEHKLKSIEGTQDSLMGLSLRLLSDLLEKLFTE
jgi:septum formation protein